MVGKAIIAEYASAKVGEFVVALRSGGGGVGRLRPRQSSGRASPSSALDSVAGELTKEWVDEGVKTDEEKAPHAAHMLEGNELRGHGAAWRAHPEQRAREGRSQPERPRSEGSADEMDPSKAPLWKQVTGTFANVLGGDDAKAGAADRAEGDLDAQMTPVTVRVSPWRR